MRVLLATVALLVALTGSAYAADVVINNGLDCSYSGNVIDDDTYQNDWVYVRNVGCGTPVPSDDCPSPGDPTEVCLVYGGYMEYLLEAYDFSGFTMSDGYVRLVHALDSSTVTMDGGEVEWLSAYGFSVVAISGGTVSGGLSAWVSSTVTMSGGYVDWLDALDSSAVTVSGGSVNDLIARDSSTVTMDGGTLGGELYADDSSTIWIVGHDFAVDGVAVSYGDLTAQTGTLTGTLDSGDTIDLVFYQGGDVWTGTITLIAPPGTEVCEDGVDNDLDGLVDFDDPDCAFLISPVALLSDPGNGHVYRSPYTARIGAIFDHSVNGQLVKEMADGDRGSKDWTVVSFNLEYAELDDGADGNCYKNDEGTPFVLYGNYYGGKDEGTGEYGIYLCYDGNSGTDYGDSENEGEDVIAAAGGNVVTMQCSCDWPPTFGNACDGDCEEGAGNYIEIEHPNGFRTHYAFLSSFEPLTENQWVDAGTVIGQLGDTGDAIVPHLHFDLINASGNHVDPYGYDGVGDLWIPPCSDGIDNDDDGKVDFPADDGCTGADDISEDSDCKDGIDNDGDKLVDSPADPGCAGPGGLREDPECDDGIENDTDGLIDFPADPGCYASSWPMENPKCDDGQDNDGDGFCDAPGPGATCTDGSTLGDPGCSDRWRNTESPECDDGINNDPFQDDLIDLDDPECETSSDSNEACGLGVELLFILPSLMWLRGRRRRELG